MKNHELKHNNHLKPIERYTTWLFVDFVFMALRHLVVAVVRFLCCHVYVYSDSLRLRWMDFFIFFEWYDWKTTALILSYWSFRNKYIYQGHNKFKKLRHNEEEFSLQIHIFANQIHNFTLVWLIYCSNGHCY